MVFCAALIRVKSDGCEMSSDAKGVMLMKHMSFGARASLATAAVALALCLSACLGNAPESADVPPRETSPESANARGQGDTSDDDSPLVLDRRSDEQQFGIAMQPNASEVVAEARARGFDGAEVIVGFDAQGNYLGETVLDDASSEVYPSYNMFWMCENQSMWIIYVNAGVWQAACIGAPDIDVVADNVSGDCVGILSESDVIVEYDGKTNGYVGRSFDDAAAEGMVAKQVGRIDAKTLESYPVRGFL